ncbi:hypothetical protein [Streptomyces sp. RFCAC02]|uniref:hypothetical protein n=1 Tax=Streptomyces sp. RFCAC02 TaxID=2499143 RepID=UPI001021BD1D|nr:hypothetical protein [Streptomyces sp. RFCAC02]
MGAEHVVGLAGLIVVVAGVVYIEEVLRRDFKKQGKRYVPPDPRCAQCGHSLGLHVSGRCTHVRDNYHWEYDGHDRVRKYNFHKVPCDCGASRAS